MAGPRERTGQVDQTMKTRLTLTRKDGPSRP